MIKRLVDGTRRKVRISRRSVIGRVVGSRRAIRNSLHTLSCRIVGICIASELHASTMKHCSMTPYNRGHADTYWNASAERRELRRLNFPALFWSKGISLLTSCVMNHVLHSTLFSLCNLSTYHSSSSLTHSDHPIDGNAVLHATRLYTSHHLRRSWITLFKTDQASVVSLIKEIQKVENNRIHNQIETICASI